MTHILSYKSYPQFARKFIQPIVRKHFKKYKYVFLKNSVTFADLYQIINFYIWNRFFHTNVLDIDNLSAPDRQLLKTVIFWEIVNEKRKADKDCRLKSLDEFLDGGEDIEDEQHEQTSLLLLDLKKHLQNREYYVIIQKVIEKKSFREIGKNLNLSKQGVSRVYNNTIKKLKKKINFCLLSAQFLRYTK